MTNKPKYLVFDIESVADGDLLAKLRYPGEQLTAAEAVSRYREELLEKHGNDFVPYTFQLPVSVAIGKVDEEFRLMDLVVLDEPQFRPHVIARDFWRGWTYYGQPTLVSFNGRGFDMPLMELAAFRFGISAPEWFDRWGRSYEQPRNRYNPVSHFDLYDLFTNFGAVRFNGGLNLAANLLGKPGKMDVQGHMVQDLYNAGQLREINDYCRCDVLDTYFVFLRSAVMLGQLDLDQEHALVSAAHQWLEAQAEQVPAYRGYLENWGDWPSPWREES